MTNFKLANSASSPEGLEKGDCPNDPLLLQTTMGKDFKGAENKICPAQVNANHREDFKLKLFEKMKELNQKFEEKNPKKTKQKQIS